MTNMYVNWGNPLSTYAKFSEKLTNTCAYQAVTNVSFSENFANALILWPHFKISNTFLPGFI